MVSKAFTFPRSHFIGFDHVWTEIEKLQDVAENSKLYPPHNVVRYTDEEFAIEMAIAGYKKEDLDVNVREGILIVTADVSKEEREYIHKGISAKKFRRTFRLSEHVVVNGADFRDGLLVINLKVVIPEEKRPRKIQIG
jgi:molecular chaperone IbpA